MRERCIAALVQYGLKQGLLQPGDEVYARNRILEMLQLDSYDEPACVPDLPLEQILAALVEDGAARGVCGDDSIGRDLFDTKIMGAITPFPSTVRREFFDRYAEDPRLATEWYYRFSQDTDYIRRYRIAKDVKWVTPTPYGDLDITINLSKPEKDPRAIAAAKAAPQSGYPKCQLCAENEGYAGRMNHPARQNHRPIPVTVDGGAWFMQYSPYVYYNEHCIVFSGEHVPMKIERATFRKLLDFVRQFPHYFVGSNADLPIVGGSILSHDHFQSGCYTFAMERAGVEETVKFNSFTDIECGIVKWPMSVLRLRCGDDKRLVELADRILCAWREYSDSSVGIFARTEGEPHNTVTPIARMRDGLYELDLVLRCNITSPEHPMGVFHPHSELHHIKKENIGLIEVMGLAVLPARLKEELAALGEALVSGGDVNADPRLEKHAVWAAELREKYAFTPENVEEILRREVGAVFARVLEHAGVFKCDEEGRAAFRRFVGCVK